MAEQTTTHAPPRLRRACRQDRILAELHAQPALRASELSQMLEVSHETIRRDLIDLDRRGLLRRTYGGAQRSLRFEAPVGEVSRVRRGGVCLALLKLSRLFARTISTKKLQLWVYDFASFLATIRNLTSRETRKGSLLC